MNAPRAILAGVGGGRPIAALDVGTSKVAALVGVAGPDGSMKPLGVGVRACSGLKRGLVADMAATETAIRAAMDQAEKQAGVQAAHVLVSLGAGGLMSDVAAVEIAVPGQRVGGEHIAALLAEGRRRIDPGGRTILHAQPALYLLDGQTPVLDPLGFHADRLGVSIHVVSADTPPIRNLDLCVRNAHLGIQAIVAAPVAAGLAVLAEEERELGVALVEIGSGVTSVAVHARGLLLQVATIAMGGGDVTDDIAAAFATRRVHAERIKAVSGSASPTPRDAHEQIEMIAIAEDDAPESSRITRAQLGQVIRQRLTTLFALVNDQLAAMGFSGPGGKQVVLTGGGAELAGIAEFAQAQLGRQVRVGRPRGLVGLAQGSPSAALATLAGLAQFAARDADDLWSLAERHAADARLDTSRSPLMRVARRLRLSL